MKRLNLYILPISEKVQKTEQVRNEELEAVQISSIFRWIALKKRQDWDF